MMKNKVVYILILTYLLATIINLIPSLKYPDSNLSVINILVSVFFLLALLVFSINKTHYKVFNLFLIFGIIGGCLIYVINKFDIAIIENLQYPLYIIFITPLFGGNAIFDYEYGVYSLLVTITYLIIYNLKAFFKKRIKREDIGVSPSSR